MCWGLGITVAMATAGSAGTVMTLALRDPAAIPATLAYFTLMQVIQIAGYGVIDQCGTPANEMLTYLAMLHIVFQPLVIKVFVMALFPPGPRLRMAVLLVAGLASLSMLIQLHPFTWAGSCAAGAYLCAERLCTVSGDWHLAWDVPYNGLLNGVDAWLGTSFGFPAYMVAVFGLPLLFGAWRFALFHLIAGPVLAGLLSSNANEVPAIWSLSSVAIAMVALSPPLRRTLRPSTYPIA